MVSWKGKSFTMYAAGNFTKLWPSDSGVVFVSRVRAEVLHPCKGGADRDIAAE